MRNRAGIETRQRILEATKVLLAERGLDGTTVKAICDAAGIRAGSFYNLFESKEQAVITVIREAIIAVDPDPDRTGADHIRDLVEAYVRFVRDEPTMMRIYLGVTLNGGLTDPSIAARIARHHAERISRFEAALRNDRPDLDDEEVVARVEAMLAALTGYTLQVALNPSFDFAAHARRLVTLEPSRQPIDRGAES